MPLTNQFGKHSSKFVILSGFISVLVLLAALVYVATFSVSNNSNSLVDIVDEQKEIANIFAMRDAAQNRALILYRMNTVSDPFLKDELYIKFKTEAEKFILARELLLEGGNSTHHNFIWQNVRPLVNNGVNLQRQTVEYILGDQAEKANEMLKKVLPAQDLVMAGLTQMLDTENSEINEFLSSAQKKNNQYYSTILSLGFIAILLGIGIAIYVYRHNRKTELALLTQQKIADSANQAKSAFLANMSHEIRTPLTAIIGFSEQILNKNLNHEEQKKIKQTIIRNSKHLQNLINEILDLSKIESGQLEIEMTAVSPVHVNYEIESIVSKRALDKNLSFIVNNEFPLPSSIITDSIRLKQILINLCSNAIKFTSEGEIQLNTKYDPEKNLISFSVTDTGIGLTSSEQEKIFNPFTQADISTTRKYGGTGLGLSISSLLANELGGTLECKSEQGQGSQFILTLPSGITGKIKMINAHETSAPLPDNSLDNLQIKQLSGKILLAEDIKDNQDLISMYVRQTGAHLDIVSNGEDAIKEALKNDYDLILMDMQMPKMDGLEAISILRKQDYTKPIVSLTANALLSDQEKCLNAGANQFLAKPINLNEFYDTLNSFLEEQTLTTNHQPVDSTVTSGMDKLIQNFIADLPNKISVLNETISTQSWEEVENVSHFLKGVGSSFGFPEITQSATLLNNAVREKNFKSAPELVTNLINLCESIIRNYNKQKLV